MNTLLKRSAIAVAALLSLTACNTYNSDRGHQGYAAAHTNSAMPHHTNMQMQHHGDMGHKGHMSGHGNFPLAQLNLTDTQRAQIHAIKQRNKLETRGEVLSILTPIQRQQLEIMDANHERSNDGHH